MESQQWKKNRKSECEKCRPSWDFFIQLMSTRLAQNPHIFQLQQFPLFKAINPEREKKKQNSAAQLFHILLFILFIIIII